jgi:hypothetical protein
MYGIIADQENIGTCSVGGIKLSLFRLNSNLIHCKIKPNYYWFNDVSMADWQITATTIYCESVDDEVTILIYGDGTSKCTGLEKYARQDKVTSRLMKKKSRKSGKQIRCLNAACDRVVEYRKKWLGN